MKNRIIIHHLLISLFTLTVLTTFPGCKKEVTPPDISRSVADQKTYDEKQALAKEPQVKKPRNKDNIEGSVQKQIDKQADEKLKVKQEKIIKEADEAIRETKNALTALEEKKTEEALAALERATGKLELILARQPTLALAPLGVQLTTRDVFTTVEAIEKARERAEELLDDGEVQRARAIIANLASEMVISVTSIPLASYPKAIKAIIPLIDNGETDKAKAALQSAMATLVVTNHVIPLPLIRAEKIIKSAKAMAEKKNRSEKENKELYNLIENARYQLKMAKALGYAKPDNFKTFDSQLEEIEKKTSGGKSGTGFFDKIEKSLSDLQRLVFE